MTAIAGGRGMIVMSTCGRMFAGRTAAMSQDATVSAWPPNVVAGPNGRPARKPFAARNPWYCASDQRNSVREWTNSALNNAVPCSNNAVAMRHEALAASKGAT